MGKLQALAGSPQRLFWIAHPEDALSLLRLSAIPEALRTYVGKRLPLKVIEADQRRDRLILSEKAAAQQLRRRRKEEASSQLAEGQVLDGTVASVTTFGLFVDVGVADGLVHRCRES